MKKNLLFRYREEKNANPVRKGFVIFMLTLLLTNSIFISAKGGDLFAAEARQLQDDELDIVYAEGLSFNYSGIVGKATEMINNGLAPVNKLTAQGTISGGANTKAGPVVNPVVSPVAPTAPVVPGGEITVAGDNSAQEPLTQPVLTPADNGNLPSATQIAENAGSVIEENPLQIDVTVGNSGSNNLGEAGVLNPGTNNVVMVTDSSQQNLSSLVNINAAGSIVPVLINIVININSKVDNLANNNNLDLSNYYRF